MDNVEELVSKFSECDTTCGSSKDVADTFLSELRKEDLNLLTGKDVLGSLSVLITGRRCSLQEGFKRKVLVGFRQDILFPAEKSFSLGPKGKYISTNLSVSLPSSVIIGAINSISNSLCFDDFYFVSHTLTDLGYKGLCGAVEKIRPDVLIKVETMYVDSRSKLGKGTIVIYGPGYSKKFLGLIEEVSKKNKVKIQKVLDYDDVRYYQTPITSCICIPVFKDKDKKEIASKQDIIKTSKILHKVLLEINRVDSFLED